MVGGGVGRGLGLQYCGNNTVGNIMLRRTKGVRNLWVRRSAHCTTQDIGV